MIFLFVSKQSKQNQAAVEGDWYILINPVLAIQA